jgi:hypothetical protein
MIAQRSFVLAILSFALVVTSAQGQTQAGATATSASANLLVFQPGSYVFGRTYAEWAEQWYQWWDLIPVPINPSYDTTGQNCNINQSQPVFFLAGDGTFSASGVTRSCTVPSNTPLFFPMITAECSNVEPAPFFGRTDADRLECARFAIDGVAPVTVVVTVDGHSVPALRDFRIASPPFNFTTPSQNNVLGLPGVTSGRSEADGYWAMLAPLKPGKHVLHFEAAISAGPFAVAIQNVTYNLTVY